MLNELFSNNKITYDFQVDTAPMAKEMEGVSSNVNHVTTAVVAMQTAVIMAENQAADHVCSNLNRGFFTLIRSQISQKMAQKRSEIEASILELKQQSLALQAIQVRMEKDFNMISRRYGKLFNSLNEALRRRIYELDKPTICFAEKEVQLSLAKTQQLFAIVPITQLESLMLGQQITASNTKKNGKQAIDSMEKFLKGWGYQKEQTDRLLLNQSIDNEANCYVPVVISETTGEYDLSHVIGFQLPVIEDIRLNTFLNSNIKTAIYGLLNQLEWETVDAKAKEEISGQFNSLLNQSPLSKRVKDTMYFLKQATNDWQKLKGN